MINQKISKHDAKAIMALFPQLQDKKWAKMDVNAMAASIINKLSIKDGVNPLLDSSYVEQCMAIVTAVKEVDFIFGGWMEDRSLLWSGHYMNKTGIESGEAIHLGVDYNVPAGTEVHVPMKSELICSTLCIDQDGGWGGQLIFKFIKTDNITPGYYILGHLRDISFDLREYATGEVVGVVAEASCNGGWAPHLHVQCCESYDVNVDGYAKASDDLVSKFPNPAYLYD